MNKILLSICVSTAALAIAGGASAGQRASERTPAETQVSLNRVDFQNPASVKAFYTRLAIAAREVCDSGITDRGIRAEDAACRREAIDRAVSQLGRPMLTAQHQSRVSTVGYARGF